MLRLTGLPHRHAAEPITVHGIRQRYPELAAQRAAVGKYEGFEFSPNVIYTGAAPKPIAPPWSALLPDPSSLQDLGMLMGLRDEGALGRYASAVHIKVH